jgi:hypothetical protein
LLELGIKILLREASSEVSGEQTQRLAAPKRGRKNVEAASFNHHKRKMEKMSLVEWRRETLLYNIRVEKIRE